MRADHAPASTLPKYSQAVSTLAARCQEGATITVGVDAAAQASGMNRLKIMDTVIGAIGARDGVDCTDAVLDVQSGTSVEVETTPETDAPAGSGLGRYPTAGPVLSGPLGGNYCDTTQAWWSPSGNGIDVQVNGPGVSEVSAQAVDTQDDPLGIGAGQINEGMSGVQIHIPNVDPSKIGGVWMAIAGAVTGTCAVQEH